MPHASRLAVERGARGSYGRLLAILASRAHDVSAAEDALSDAFAAALTTWRLAVQDAALMDQWLGPKA